MKPMLSATVEDVEALRYPLLASPKLDGIRCLIVGGRAYSRNMKMIPNEHILTALEGLPPLDGELIVGDPKAPDCFNRSTSGVMSRAGTPKFVFWAFDVHTGPFSEGVPFYARLKAVREYAINSPFVRPVVHKAVKSAAELLEYEAQMLIAGFEGVMVRDPNGPYKFGRATLREGYLSKLKRFADGEATVLGYAERESNRNEQTRDELGRAKRSSHKAGKVPTGTLGALKVRDTKTGVEFEIGTGFDDETRQFIWTAQERYLGALVKYKSQPVGAMDKPRFPVFLGFRSPNDL